MIAPEKFWDRVAPAYAKRKVSDMASYDATMERTRAHLKPGDRVLELGCGTGTTALRLADAVDHLTGTDISSAMIAIARDKAARQGVSNVTFRHAALVQAAAGDGPYDVVMAFNLLHLLEDLPGALAAINAMVKPGGLFISKSGCLGEKGIHLRLLIGVMQMFGKAPFVVSLKTRDLEEQVTRAGFTIIETHTYPGIAPTRFIVAHKP